MSGHRALGWWPLWIALLACCAYGPALLGELVFDDVHSVGANPALHDLRNFGRYWTDPGAFSGTASRMYRPALLTSFALNIAVSPAAWSLKAGNVLLHAGTAALLGVWLWRWSRRRWTSIAAAAVFAVHPLASEAINLVSARSEVLAAFGMLLALLGHLRWLRMGGGVGAVVGVGLGVVLACGSKETGVVLPLLFVVQSVCLRHRGFARRDLRRAVPPIVLAAVLVLGYLVARKLLLGQATVQLLGRSGADPLAGYSRTLTMQLATMGTLLPQALLQGVWPWELSIDPQVQYREGFADPWVLTGWLSLAGLTLGLSWSGPSARLRRVGLAFAIAVALPWIVIPLNMPMAEHRLYGPLLGAAAVMAAILPRLRRQLRGWCERSFGRQHLWWSPRMAGAVVLLGVVVGIVGSGARSLQYRDERLLWQAELARGNDSFRCWWGLGTSRRRAGDGRGAVAALENAHVRYPEHFDSLRHFTEALLSLPPGHETPARARLAAERLQRLGPLDPWVRTLVAQAELQSGRLSGEREWFERAERTALSCLEVAAAKGYVYQLAAEARLGLEDAAGALAHLDASIARGLDAVPVRLLRVDVLRRLGRAQDAQRELRIVQQQAPLDPLVLQRLQAAPTR